MVFRSFNNGEGAIDRLDGDDSHQLMRKGQLREGETEVGGGFYTRRETVGASYDKAHVTVRLGCVLYCRG